MHQSLCLPGKDLTRCLLVLMLVVTAVSTPVIAGEFTLSTVGAEQWDDRFGYPGVEGAVHAIAVDGNNVYVGGSLLKAGGVESGSILRWDGNRWHELGGGVKRPSIIFGEANGVVNTIAVSDGKVYVGGQFTKAGTVEANNIALWDGTDWSALDNGIVTGGSVDAAAVNAIAVDGDTVYVGGNFDTAGSTAVASIARWHESTGSWSMLGSGLGGAPYIDPRGTAHSIVVTPDGVYVGGDFQSAGGAPANAVARWNEAAESWTALGQGLRHDGYTGEVYTLAVSGDQLYAGGRFDMAGTVGANNIALWNSVSQNWASLGTGVGDVAIMGQVPVLSISVDGTKVYAGGNFTTAGGTTANRIASWNGSNWQPMLSGGVNGTNASVRALATMSGELYAGGEFLSAGEKNVFYVARWDGAEWFALGQGIEVPGLNAIAVNQHGEVYVGGFFSHVGGVPANNLARWSGQRWHALGSGVEGGSVTALVASGDDLYVGGRFIEAGDQEAYYVARWNEKSDTWSALGDGLGYDVEALALSGTTLYVGGRFVTAGGEVEIAMARYDTVTGQWDGLGDSLFIDDPYGNVYAIVTHGNLVYIGGSFETVNYKGTGGIPVNGLLVWDSNQDEWSTIDDGSYVGVGGTAVHALALQGDYLYVGGSLYSAGPLSTSGVARYNLSTGKWSTLGTGLGGGSLEVRALSSDGASIYVGGSFESASGLIVNNVARWDSTTNQWASLAGGVTGRTGPVQENDVFVEALVARGGSVYVGGSFLEAGALPSHDFGRWVETAPTQSAIITNATGGELSNSVVAIEFPSGAVGEDVIVSYTPLHVGVHTPANGATSLRAWSLEARTENGELVSHFLNSYTLTIPYTEGELEAQGIDENNLSVSYWNGTSWTNMLPCSGCVVDTDDNVITIIADHFTEFALTAFGIQGAPGQGAVYLPMVVR